MGDEAQSRQMAEGRGFIAALDQSGGSTPKALGLYGIAEDAWSGEAEMFALVHEMRARIAAAPAFTGDRVIAAILFEDTMEREIGGMPTGEFLWKEKGIVPLLKVDEGLAEPADGARLMKPLDGLDALLDRAVAKGMFGTKMRSVIEAADAAGVEANAAQQFEVGRRILARGLVPILEPEILVAIEPGEKSAAEALLLDALLAGLDGLAGGERVMLKLTLPEEANHYLPLVEHPRVMRVAALSGGYSRSEANARLARNRGMIASFSRALAEGLSAHQSDAEFDAALAASVESIFEASVSG